VDPSVVIAGLIGLLGATWSALIAGFYRGDFVAGHVYRREVIRGDNATKTVELLARAKAKPDAPVA
jgi:hypothetical protein